MILFAAAVALATLPSLPASAISYSFVNIADDSGPFDHLGFGGASINNSGLVAFRGTREGVPGIYTGSGGPIATIADTSGPLSDVGSSASINDAGLVAFHAYLDAGGEGLFTGSGGPTNPIIDSSGPFFTFDPPAINNSTSVAFRATLDNGNEGIFRSDGGNPVTIAELGGTLSLIPFFGAPAINNSGTVAFAGFRRLLPGGCGLCTGSGIFTGDGGPIDTAAFVVSAGGFFETPSINDIETTSFVRHFTNGERTMFISSDGVSTPFVTASGSGPFGGLDYPQINSAGDVAFQGYVFQPVEGYGIYTGPDPAADKVIQTGDTLFGSTVLTVNLTVGRRLNDNGDIVFDYALTNGIAGIAVARLSLPGDYNASGTVDAADYVVWRKTDGTPAGYNTWRTHFGQPGGSGSGASTNTVVPEPATLVLMFAAAGLCLRRRRNA